MKFLLLLILTLTPQILNKEITIDLENKGRVGSEFTKQLPEKRFFYPLDANFVMKQETNNINFELKGSTLISISLSTEVPAIKIFDGHTPLAFSLTPKPSEECLLFNFPKNEEDLDINCTYTNARYSISTNSFVNKAYKKELSIGVYLLSLTESGVFEIGLIKSIKLVYSDSPAAKHFKENFKQFDEIVIKNFFISSYLESTGSGVLTILTEEQLLVFKFKAASQMIEFEKVESFKLKALSMDLTELKNVFYLNTECFVILKNAFYKLTRKPENWENNSLINLTLMVK
jgi:hypothetical protein